MGFRVIGSIGRSFDDDEMRDERRMKRELDRAYHEGWEDAMEEMRGYGERGGNNGGSSGSGGYGERMDREWMEDGDYFGERRGVKGTGPYSRYRRR